MVSFAVIAQISSQERIARYESLVETSIAMRFGFVGMMLACLYGGVLFRMSRDKLDRLLAVLTIGSIAFVYTMQGSRMGVLYGGSFWVAAYLATHVFMTGARPGSDRAVLMAGLATVVILIGLSTVAMVVRYTATDDVDWQVILADPFTFVGVFGIWFDQTGFTSDNLLYGARVFRRIFEAFGVVPDIQPAIPIGYTSSNIYTVFRDLIEDFGSIGALGMMFFYGFLARIAFAATASGRAAVLPWLGFIYAFALTSFASGMLSYTTSTVAILFFGVSYHFIAQVEPVAAAVPLYNQRAWQ
jgi:oligosaccharide repeat unit polymerase